MLPNGREYITYATIFIVANATILWIFSRAALWDAYSSVNRNVGSAMSAKHYSKVICKGISSQLLLDCLLNSIFRRRSKKTLKLRVTGLCEGNPPYTGGFSSQGASNAENFSIWWRHHGTMHKLHTLSSWTNWNDIPIIPYIFENLISFVTLTHHQYFRHYTENSWCNGTKTYQ